MLVSRHAKVRLFERLTAQPALRVIARLEAMAGTCDAVAIEVHRFAHRTTADGSNGDAVVVIAREGTVETVMLRRSWNQPFTPSALGVDRIEVLPS